MGVTFKDAHSTPLCAPSRYMLLSGNYAHRGHRPSGSWSIKGEQNQFQPLQKSIAETLKESGYHTAMYGKWHLGGKIPLKLNGTRKKGDNILRDKDHDWSRALIDGPQDIGFDSSLITASGIQSPPYSYFRDGFLTTNISDVVFWEEGKYSAPHGESVINRRGEGDPGWDSTAYNMVIVNETASFLDAHMDSNRSQDPWFVYAALGAVHAPHSPPDHYLDDTPIAGTYQTRHMDMLLETDMAVGSLVTIVEDRGLANDTIIIFASDNGGAKDSNSKSSKFGHNSHGPLRGQKGEIYEGGHRVPLIFRHDGHFPINENRHHMVGLNDVYKTLCDLIGIKVPEASAEDSVSFANYIFSESRKNALRKSLATWVIQRGVILSEAIRFDKMKLIQHYGVNAKTELYDLNYDISEKFNLLPNDTYAGLEKVMRDKLVRLGPCPKDRKRFKIERGAEKGEKKRCDFFSSDRTRCNSEAEKRCHSICGRNTRFCDHHKMNKKS